MTYAIVTGAAQGLGAAIVRDLETNGVECVTVGHGCEYETDLRNYSRWVESIVSERSGALPVALINNAGITRIRRFTDVRDLDWDDVMDVNLRTPFKATQALVRLAEKVNRDSYKPNHVVVNIASMGWRAPLRMSAAYCASKAALVHLTRTLAKELIDTHPYMRLYAVCPNTLEGTKMTQQVEDALVNVRGFTREAAQKYLRNNGYGKLQNPSEVAGTVSYLVTEQPEFMNGGVFEYPAGMS